eukprot:GSChrysophyteH1.ASY1.ANO1.681.1 assembled CDS
MLVFVLIFAAVLCVARSEEGVPFTGMYSDPNHPDCYRKIVDNQDKLSVYGQDNKGGEGVSCMTKDKAQLDNWGPCPAVADATSITVDLSSKGGPSDLSGTWDAKTSRIVWADGNYWQHAPEKRANVKDE